MIDFKIYENDYHLENNALLGKDDFREKSISLGNKYLIGNGYMGIRGTLEEARKEMLPAVNLSGIYDKVGDCFREPLNAPNPCYSYLRIDGLTCMLPDIKPVSHRISLDYNYGIFTRSTTWHTSRGNVSLVTERFASMADIHLIGMRFSIKADFHADIELVTGIDCDIWEMNGPHYSQMELCQQHGQIYAKAITGEQSLEVGVSEKIDLDFPAETKIIENENTILRRIFFITQPGKTYTINKFCAVYTQKDCPSPAREAFLSAGEYASNGYQKCLQRHKKVWDELWYNSKVTIVGDDTAMEAINYSLYHLLSIAPRHTTDVSIPARGLSGQTYRGAVFWDTEMFMLDFFLFTQPDTAKSLLTYRIDTLDGALKKAASYHLDGAFYAWESQEGGFDACSDYNVIDVFTGRPMRTFFKDKQVHISSAIVYGIMRYVDFTGDYSILSEDGVSTIIECARFYYSLLLKPLGVDRYEIRDVIGPDEYHERVNNNGYTNRMAKYTFEKAIEIIAYAKNQGICTNKYDLKELKAKFADAAEKLYIPQPNEEKIIEQFDGYFELEDASLSDVKSRLLDEREYWGGAYGVASHTKIIKQADVVTWLNLFSDDFNTDVMRSNWNYYEPRTEHGSSLSAGMYSILACKLGEPEKAYPFFMKSALADLKGGGKEWAGLLYIGGTHPAAAGAAYMTAIEGFAGIQVKNGKLICEPNLPPQFSEMHFKLRVKGTLYQIDIVGKEHSIKELD